MARTLFIAIAALMLAGCALFGGRDEANLPPGSRVGIINLMQSRLSHYHTGFTVFTSFDRKYEGTGHPAAVLAELQSALGGRKDLEFATIEPTRELLAIGTDVFRKFPMTGLNPAFAPELRQIARQQDIDHFLVIAESCGPVPHPRTGEMCGYGLYTERAPIGVFRAFAYFNVSFLRITPEGELLRPVSTLRPSETVVELKMALQPEDVDAITREELQKVEPFIRQIAAAKIADAAELLR